jgi:hypothetical protein
MIELLKSKGLGAFWARGSLSALDRACLSSFANRGYDVTLFSYDPISNLPQGIKPADASNIVPEAMVQRVIYNGRPDLAHFSDLFRYEMIKKADLIWIDVDLIMIDDFAIPDHSDVIVKEEQGGINGAILYLADKKIMRAVSSAMETKLDKELRWGETGPAIILEVVSKYRLRPLLYQHTYFYPIEHYDIWKVFLPAHRDECASQCSGAVTLHLFNNILSTIGYWKDIAPPVGSYLHELLDRADLLRFFNDVYPERVISAGIENFRFRQSGKALGIKAVMREIIPSIGRTYRHYHK